MEFTTESFEHACKILGMSTELPDVSKVEPEYGKKTIAHYKRMIITESINFEANGHKKWIPDYTNESCKYEIWVCIKYVYSHTNAGSRLCFISREAANYYINNFEENFKENMLYN